MKRLIILLLLATQACSSAGGGWVLSAGSDWTPETGDEVGKATFGLQVQCGGETDGVTGQLDYNDNGADVRFHGEATATEFCASFTGDYIPQPQSAGEGGTFELQVTDIGEPGVSAGDYFSITLTGGIYDGYANAGELGGGNIQFHD